MIIEELKNTAVRCDTMAEYMAAAGLYQMAGAPIWPWHKGYKSPEADHHNAPFYGWEECGFLKQIFPMNSDSTNPRLITMKELAETVLNRT